MHISKLIIGGDNIARKKEVDKEIEKKAVSTYDIHEIYPSEKTNKIGIASVKQCIRDVQLTPVEGTTKAVVFYEFQTATREAQNALLKLIEEPDSSTIVLLTADRKESILPTIVSRCQLISLSRQAEKLLDADNLYALLKASEAERFAFAEELAQDKQRASEQLTSVIAELQSKLRKATIGEKNKEEIIHLLHLIRTLERGRISLLKTNTNPRLLLENLLLECSL